MGITIEISGPNSVRIDGVNYVRDSAPDYQPENKPDPRIEQQADRIVAQSLELGEMREQVRSLDKVNKTLLRDIEQLENKLASRATLSPYKWDALATAERPLFADEHGAHAFTSVLEADDAPWLAELWDHCQLALEASWENWDTLSTDQRNRFTANRVARTLAVAAFGPEFLLR